MGANDFWGQLFIAHHLDVRNPASFYNGFYPLGYPVFLRLASSVADPLVAAYVANVIFAMVTLAVVGRAGARALGPAWAIACVVAVALIPGFFMRATSQLADLGAVAFFTVGAWLVLADRRQPMVVGAAILALGALWRFHVLLLAGTFLVSALVVTARSWRQRAALGAIFAAVYGPQMVVGVIVGHGPFGTAQNFNVQKFLHGIDWYHVSRTAMPDSILAVIAATPARFLDRYVTASPEYFVWFLPSLLCLVVACERRMHAVLCLALVVYLPVVVIGGAPQSALLPIFPLVTVQMATLASWTLERLRGALPEGRFVRAGACAALVLVGVSWLAWFAYTDVKVVAQRITEQRTMLGLQRVLVGDGVREARQVFSSDFDVYFPHILGWYPYIAGGWARYSLYGYDRERPPLSVESLEAFATDSRAQGITHWLLTPNAAGMLAELGQVYRGERRVQGLARIADVDGVRIFRLGP